MQNFRVYRSAEVYGTEQKFIISTFWLHFMSYRGRNQRPKVLDLERLRGQACKSAFALEIRNSFDYLQSVDLEVTGKPSKGKPYKQQYELLDFVLGAAGARSQW